MADSEESQIFLTVILGLVILLVALYYFFFNKKKTEDEDVVENYKPEEKTVKTNQQTAKDKSNNKSLAANNEKKKKKNLAPPVKDNGINSPLLIASLKGHTGIVHSLDFSTNGKLLASCSDGKSLWFYYILIIF